MSVALSAINQTLPDTLGSVPVVGDASRLLEWISRERVTELALTSTREMSGDLFQAVMDAYERGVTITPVPILYERDGPCARRLCGQSLVGGAAHRGGRFNAQTSMP